MRTRLAFAVLLACSPSATATPGARTWMTEDAMRQAFIGKTLDGHYLGGLAWTETYLDEGRLDYREPVRKATGRWLFRGQVFCTFYDPGYGLNGGCWRTIQTGDNCFEFYEAYATRVEKGEGTEPDSLDSWVARGWRNSEPSTCEDRPSA